MNAADVARALGDARREGRGWRCRCPLHGGRSLMLRDGDATRVARARAIWREALPAAGTIVEKYLEGRYIILGDLPADARGKLRFHPRCPHPSDAPLPVMIGLVEHSDRGFVGIHRTYLCADGAGKTEIEPAKASLGSVGGGAVRFGMPRTHESLAVAEGIETALSVAVACAMPAWAALSAGGIRALVLPREATHVVICADHDASGTGQRAAQDAAQRWLAEGRHVRIAMPPEPDTDMADVLLGHDYALSNEAHHVA
jgi:putative DNA primase/helicase